MRVNQTLSRTILTSLTTFFSGGRPALLRGKTLEDFAFVLFVGVITGTYSTTYVAAATGRRLDEPRRRTAAAREESGGKSLTSVSN